MTSLPGIGKTLEEKLVALMETGDIPAAVKLRAKYPAGLMEMTRLPGLGPKRARKLFDELGIDSLEDAAGRGRGPAAAQRQGLRAEVRGLDALLAGRRHRRAAARSACCCTGR